MQTAITMKNGTLPKLKYDLEIKMDIGIAKKDREATVNGLQKTLADTYSLYLKTQNYHWNVTGPMFKSLHELFEVQYTEMIPALDTIAERIRALGFLVEATFDDFKRLSEIAAGRSEAKAMEMVKELVDGNETVVRTARASLKIAEEAGDDPTVDLLTERLAIHEKNAWMLRSTLQKD
jgi:starvation-inducible DNA-binding protein